jgi:cyclase
MGVEKIAISSSALEDPPVIGKIAEVVGSQSVVVVIDVKKDVATGDYAIWTKNGTHPTGIAAIEFTGTLQRLGAGEVVVNSVDCDGLMKGYDLELARAIRAATSLPITVLGGAGSLEDIGNLIRTLGIVGAAAGSLFVFKGIYRAVLINYPNRAEKAALYGLNERTQSNGARG